MTLRHLDITHFRNLISVKIDPILEGFNLIDGNNGSGKTSLLEAIYYLSLGRSFRNTVSDRIIHYQAEKLSIFAYITSLAAQSIPVGIERSQQAELTIRIANHNANSIAELAHLIPVLLIHSQTYHLLESGPIFRRKYLYWSAFYVAPEFGMAYKKFNQALKQRNAALRSQNRMSTNELQIWNKKLHQQAIEVDRLCCEHMKQLIPILHETIARLLSLKNVTIEYYRGWDESISYEEIIKTSLARDIQLGYTQFGPHKADIKIRINGIPAKDILSRGQQKLFVCAMILSQGILLRDYVEKKSIYLVDDLPAELDIQSRSRLMALLAEQKTQVFVTAIDRDMLTTCLPEAPTAMFHVEHGSITAEQTTSILSVG